MREIKSKLLFAAALVLIGLAFFLARSAGAKAVGGKADSTAVDVEVTTITYYRNGGADDVESLASVKIDVPSDSHRRFNTEISGYFERDGYTLAAWNTKPDGRGERIGLGSRVSSETTALYAVWEPWSDASLFDVEEVADGLMITGYHGHEEKVVIPAEIGGVTVTAIGKGAFQNNTEINSNNEIKSIILPPTIVRVKDAAFADLPLEEVTLFDSLTSLSASAFKGCDSVKTLHINAATAPRYSGTYYDTFPDKLDYLRAHAADAKLVLFSGSSTRFGYDSPLMARTLGREVVNMGVFAYTNALMQLDVIRQFMQAGDVLLLSPEFDAAKRQFCTTNEFDAAWFYMTESDYDITTKLDLTAYKGVFGALSTFLSAREGMEAKSYDLSPAMLDEDGNPVAEPSYNENGDYIVYRPDSDTDAPVYGLAVEYTISAFPKEYYLDPLNAVTDAFEAEGIHVYLTFSPRNKLAVSTDSTPEAVAALDEYFRENLHIEIISRLEDSLVDGTILYGTDNHLSTRGVELRTKAVLDELLARAPFGAGEVTE